MATRRAWRWGLGLGLPLAALALFLVLFRWDWLIPIVEAQASARLGRPVTLEHLHVGLGRTVTVTAEGLRVGNPEGFPEDPPFALLPRSRALRQRLEQANAREAAPQTLEHLGRRIEVRFGVAGQDAALTLSTPIARQPPLHVRPLT